MSVASRAGRAAQLEPGTAHAEVRIHVPARGGSTSDPRGSWAPPQGAHRPRMPRAFGRGSPSHERSLSRASPSAKTRAG
jgi:hypothetical protein